MCYIRRGGASILRQAMTPSRNPGSGHPKVASNTGQSGVGVPPLAKGGKGGISTVAWLLHEQLTQPGQKRGGGSPLERGGRGGRSTKRVSFQKGSKADPTPARRGWGLPPSFKNTRSVTFRFGRVRLLAFLALLCRLFTRSRDALGYTEGNHDGIGNTFSLTDDSRIARNINRPALRYARMLVLSLCVSANAQEYRVYPNDNNYNFKYTLQIKDERIDAEGNIIGQVSTIHDATHKWRMDSELTYFHTPRLVRWKSGNLATPLGLSLTSTFEPQYWFQRNWSSVTEEFYYQGTPFDGPGTTGPLDNLRPQNIWISNNQGHVWHYALVQKTENISAHNYANGMSFTVMANYDASPIYPPADQWTQYQLREITQGIELKVYITLDALGVSILPSEVVVSLDGGADSQTWEVPQFEDAAWHEMTFLIPSEVSIITYTVTWTGQDGYVYSSIPQTEHLKPESVWPDLGINMEVQHDPEEPPDPDAEIPDLPDMPNPGDMPARIEAPTLPDEEGLYEGIPPPPGWQPGDGEEGPGVGEKEGLYDAVRAGVADGLADGDAGPGGEGDSGWDGIRTDFGEEPDASTSLDDLKEFRQNLYERLGAIASILGDLAFDPPQLSKIYTISVSLPVLGDHTIDMQIYQSQAETVRLFMMLSVLLWFLFDSLMILQRAFA